jgi:hypothetical protein
MPRQLRIHRAALRNLHVHLREREEKIGVKLKSAMGGEGGS